MVNSAIVLLSGGIDSAVALHWAKAQGWELTGLTFDYRERPTREAQATRALAKHANLQRLLHVPLPFLAEVPDQPKDLVRNPALAHAPEGYIPSRNLVFYGIAIHYAELLNACTVVGGHLHTDVDSFPDASPAFFKGLERAAVTGLWSKDRAERPLRIALPLKDLSKRGVLDLGRKLHVPFELTWSCYWDTSTPCGTCASCIEREEAFKDANLQDPLASATAASG